MTRLASEVLSRDPPLLSTKEPSVPVAVAAAVKRALAKAPEERFASMTTVFDVIDNAVRASAAWAIPPAPATDVESAPAVSHAQTERVSRRRRADEPTLLFSFLDDIGILVHGSNAPSDADWGHYLEAAAEMLRGKPNAVPMLVVTDGARPSSAQREAMNRLYPHQLPVAVVTGSPLARGVVGVLSWFNPLIRAFPPYSVRDALAYLRIDASRHDDVLRIVAAMRVRLAGAGLAAEEPGAAMPPMDAVVTRLSKLRQDVERRRGRS